MADAMEIKVKGLAELKREMQDRVDKTPGLVAQALMKGGLLVAAQAQRNVSTASISINPRTGKKFTGGTGLHVRTGVLRASIFPKLRGKMRVTVGTKVVYARIHEYGGRMGNGGQMPARPYLRPALAKKLKQVVQIIKRVWAGGIKSG